MARTKKTNTEVKEANEIKETITETIKLEDIYNNSTENKPKEKKNKFLVLVFLALIVVAIAAIIITNTSKNTYSLSEISQEDISYKISLPHDYYLVDSGEIIKKNGNSFSSIGGVQAFTASEEEFDQMLEAYSDSYKAQEIEVNNHRCMKISITSDNTDETLVYHYILIEDKIISIGLLNTDDSLMNQIIESIK